MSHDELYRVFVNMVVFPTVAEIGQTSERLVNGRHFKCRKIMNVFMPQRKFISVNSSAAARRVDLELQLALMTSRSLRNVAQRLTGEMVTKSWQAA